MAKDPTQGPVTKYDAEGNPYIEEPAEEPAEESEVEAQDEATAEDGAMVEEAGAEEVEEESTRSEIIDEFGEELGGKLIEMGYASFSAMTELADAQAIEALDLEDDERSRLMLFLVDPAEDGEVDGDADVEEIGDGTNEEAMEMAEGIGVVDDGTETAPTEEELEAQKEILEDAGILEDDEDEEELSPEEIVYEFHEHQSDAPFTYQQAKDALEQFDFYEMREMVKELDLEPTRKKDELIQQLLDVWFPAPPPIPDEPEFSENVSVRVKRIQEASGQ